jgi:type IV pilus assembly protein PilF
MLSLLLGGCASTGKLERAEAERDMRTAARANTQLGIEYLREGNYEMSKKKLQKALELDPDYLGAHEAIAVLYGRVGENDLADKHYRKALRLAPERAQTHNNYGQFLCSQGRYDDAEKEFMIAANDPYYDLPALPLTNAGLCAEKIPDEEKAEELFRMALERNPGFGPALLQMARVSYEKENHLSARGYMQRFQQVTTHSPESLWLAIQIELGMGDHEAWGNYAVMLKNKFPDSTEAERLRQWENERVSQ